MRLTRVTHWGRTLGVSLLLGVFLILAGCGKPQATVSGKVTYKGKPVPAGQITLIAPESGKAIAADLDSSGSFTCPGTLEVGNYLMFIMPPIPKQLPPGTPIQKVPFDVPKKYQDPKTSPLKEEIKGGKNELTIDLKD